MSKTHNEPLLVQIPETKEWIDIRSFINFISRQGDEEIESGIEVSKLCIEEDIRFIATRLTFQEISVINEEDHQQLTGIFSDMFHLKDMFSNLSIIKKQEVER